VHVIINGLPAGTTVRLTGIHRDFVCNRGSNGTPPGVCDFVPSPACEKPGGTLGGAEECADSTLRLQLQGTGVLSNWSRQIPMPISFMTHVGPRTPNAPVQQFPTDMHRLEGQLPPGDPDFDLLRITAGTGNAVLPPVLGDHPHRDQALLPERAHGLLKELVPAELCQGSPSSRSFFVHVHPATPETLVNLLTSVNHG